MKFFCMSDTHGGQPPAACMYMSDQVILHAGDFYNEGSPKAHFGWDEVLSKNDILMVRGNHDCVDTELLQSHDLTMGLSKVGDLWVVGLGWCGQEYNQLPPEALMTKMVIRLLETITKVFSEGDQCVLVTHYLPTGPNFKNWEGWEFKSINALIEAIRPVAVVAGHRHGLAGKVFYQGDIPIIFPGPKGGWLEVEEGVAKWKS
jgi:Icc-related predicted phosphoesterase